MMTADAIVTGDKGRQTSVHGRARNGLGASDIHSPPVLVFTLTSSMVYSNEAHDWQKKDAVHTHSYLAKGIDPFKLAEETFRHIRQSNESRCAADK